MFGKVDRFEDSDLGVLTRRRGAWRGEMRIDWPAVLELVVPGGRSGPDPDAVMLARSAQAEFLRCRAQIAAAIETHRVESAVTPTSETTATPTYVGVVSLDRRPVLEFGFVVPWDDDHMLGARVLDGELIELCGSVIKP